MSSEIWSFQGGGMLGMAHVGAVKVMRAARGLPAHAVGTSAGAIGAAFLCAGADDAWMRQEMMNIHWADVTRVGDWLTHLGKPGMLAEAVLKGGVYPGDDLERIIAGELAKLGVTDFASLAAKQAQGAPQLHAVAYDISAKRRVVFPEDYALYGLDPMKQSVAHAVRASASVPLFFQPTPLIDSQGQKHFLVDGGVVADDPREIAMELADTISPRPDVVGFRLTGRPGPNEYEAIPEDMIFGMRLWLAMAQGAGLGGIHDLLQNPTVQANTIQTDTSGVDALTFTQTPETLLWLERQGERAAQEWLGLPVSPPLPKPVPAPVAPAPTIPQPTGSGLRRVGVSCVRVLGRAGVLVGGGLISLGQRLPTSGPLNVIRGALTGAGTRLSAAGSAWELRQ